MTSSRVRKNCLASILIAAFVFSFACFASSKEASAASQPTWKSSSVSGTQIKLSWNAVSGAYQYKIYYKKSTAKTYTCKTLKGTSCTFNGTKGVTYNFYFSYDSLRSAAIPERNFNSKVLTITIPNPTVMLSTPTALYLTSGNKTLTVSWTSVKNAPVYAIQYRKSGTTSWKTVYVVPNNSKNTKNFYTISGLSGSYTYQCRVSARATKGSGFTHSSYTSIVSKKPYQSVQWSIASSGSSDNCSTYNTSKDAYKVNW